MKKIDQKGFYRYLFTDCSYTRLGFESASLKHYFLQRFKNSTIIIIDSATCSFSALLSDALRVKIRAGITVKIFILSYDKQNAELINGIHFLSKKMPVGDLLSYINNSCLGLNKSQPALTFDIMKIIFLQFSKVDDERICRLSGKSKSTIKNCLSYTKRKLGIKNKISEKALIEVVSCIFTLH